jgi:hypothetical protein
MLGTKKAGLSSPQRTVRTKPPALSTWLVGLLVFGGLITSFVVSTVSTRSRITNPEFGLVVFRDESASFTAQQMQVELGVHDSIYTAAFGAGTPVQYRCFAFGNDLVEVGGAVTTKADQTWPILDKKVPVDPSGSRFAPALDQVTVLAESQPGRIFGVVFLSDGESTDWKSLEQSAREIAKQANVAFVAVCGSISSARLRLRTAMQPLGDRFVPCDPSDTNANTISMIAALIERARSKK